MLTLTLWALHGKNGVKSRWCPLWSEPFRRYCLWAWLTTRKWPETRDFLLYEIVNGSLTFSITALQKCVLCDCNFVLYVMSSCTRLSNRYQSKYMEWTIFNLNFILSQIIPENNPRTISFITKLKCVSQMHCGVDTLQNLHISVKGD